MTLKLAKYLKTKRNKYGGIISVWFAIWNYSMKGSVFPLLFYKIIGN